jgi:hypothetical protein
MVLPITMMEKPKLSTKMGTITKTIEPNPADLKRNTTIDMKTKPKNPMPKSSTFRLEVPFPAIPTLLNNDPSALKCFNVSPPAHLQAWQKDMKANRVHDRIDHHPTHRNATQRRRQNPGRGIPQQVST